LSDVLRVFSEIAGLGVNAFQTNQGDGFFGYSLDGLYAGHIVTSPLASTCCNELLLILDGQTRTQTADRSLSYHGFVLADLLPGAPFPTFDGVEFVGYYSDALDSRDPDFGTFLYRTVDQQLEALKAEVVGIAPGTSLADKVTMTKASYDANDVGAACPMLTAFVNEVQAQTGKTIATALAAQLLADAEVIQSKAIRCR
jgi:hypothetical protein